MNTERRTLFIAGRSPLIDPLDDAPLEYTQWNRACAEHDVVKRAQIEAPAQLSLGARPQFPDLQFAQLVGGRSSDLRKSVV